MKTFRVQFYYTESGTAEIYANSKREAEKKMERTLAYSGLDDLSCYDCKGRDYASLSVEEVK